MEVGMPLLTCYPQLLL